MNQKIKLIFIPHAGSSCLSYGKLIQEAPPDVEVEILDLPGRNKFYHDPWPITWDELIPILYKRVKPDNTPLIIMGHSFGALVALELAAYCLLKKHHVILGVSGMNAPTSEYVSRRKKISRLPEIEFIEHLKEFSDMPVSMPTQFMQLMKADFSMLEEFPLPLKRNISTLVFGGQQDPLTCQAGLEAWSQVVDLKQSPQMYLGNHFQFFLGHIRPIIRVLIDSL